MARTKRTLYESMGVKTEEEYKALMEKRDRERLTLFLRRSHERERRKEWLKRRRRAHVSAIIRRVAIKYARMKIAQVTKKHRYLALKQLRRSRVVCKIHRRNLLKTIINKKKLNVWFE